MTLAWLLMSALLGCERGCLARHRHGYACVIMVYYRMSRVAYNDSPVMSRIFNVL